MTRVAVVVPTIRSAEHLAPFFEAWRPAWDSPDVALVLVEDRPGQTLEAPWGSSVVLSWRDMELKLGRAASVIPRQTDGVRSFGFWYASEALGCDVVVTVDDDCYPADPGGVAHLGEHVGAVSADTVENCWVSTVRGGGTPRGVPYDATERRRPVVLNHGLWVGSPDLDAPTELVARRHRDAGRAEPFDFVVPVGKYYPMCGMNVAFRALFAPAMYFPPMGKGQPYDRFGDIWAGVLSKRVADHLGWGITSGRPVVEHRRASSVWANLRKEAAGLEANETFWSDVDRARLGGATVVECYRELADAVGQRGDDWSRKAARDMRGWADLFGGL